MHPRNAYRQAPDWGALIASDASLHAWEGKLVDMGEPATRRAFTEALLRRDFGIECQMAPHRLCPTLPNRLNYIHWMEDLLQATGVDGEDVHGLDIGTGHVAVYALLVTALHPKWRMTGTDVDADAVAWAQRIVSDPRNAAHAWKGRLQLVHTSPTPLLPNDTPYTFVLCNPPFYESLEERGALLEAKSEYVPPCEAMEAELCTPGGEVAFPRWLRLYHWYGA
ncbi:23S rRNA (adenine(1618)-N(6))-methyltransferase [Malassezia nana]|uniref:23S rRNA (Adenine(1618)-N(6))-methyltransferase n=1 Tax=Malassezia nana TaxID=180528 RepID=A0AAF0EQ62_9BASI|nr:23S rRNA (adenine(1618)-N(6))-methyltransferase [Malassezia nana]